MSPARRAQPVVTTALWGVTILSGGAYRGVRRSVVLDMKERGRWRLATGLATSDLVAAMNRSIAENPRVIVVPLASSVQGRFARGYLPTVHFAQALLSEQPGVAITVAVTPGFRALHVLRNPLHRPLRRSRQDRLSRRFERFRVRGLPAHSSVILVDDVMATGATLDASAHALHAHGHRVVLAVVAAHVPLRVRTPIPSLAKPGYSEGTTLTRRT